MIPARDIDSIEEEQQQVTAEEDLIKLSIQQTQETIRKYKELLRKCGGEMALMSFFEEVLPAPLKAALINALKYEPDLFTVLRNSLMFYLAVMYLGEKGSDESGGKRRRSRGGDEEEELDREKMERLVAQEIAKQAIASVTQQQHAHGVDASNPFQQLLAGMLMKFIQERMASIGQTATSAPITPPITPQVQQSQPPQIGQQPPQQKKKNVIDISEL